MYTKLESLRGLAALMVVLLHTPYDYGPAEILFVKNSGYFVDFFFILSGFVMTFAYKEKIAEGMKFTKYILLRFARLYPLHLFMLIVWLPYVLLKYYAHSIGYGETEMFRWSNEYTFLSNLLLIHSLGVHDVHSWNTPSWSISTEFYTYIVFFIISVFIDKKDSLLIPIIISSSLYYFLYSLDTGDMLFTIDYGIVRCIAAFYLGTLIFRIKQRISLDTLNQNFMEIFATACVITSITYANDGYVFIFLSFASFMLSMLVFSSEKSGLIGNTLNMTAFRKMGLWSYSIYMTHRIVIDVLSNIAEYVFKVDLFGPGFGFYAVIINIAILAFVVLISRFTYVYVEKYFQDLLKPMIYRKVKA